MFELEGGWSSLLERMRTPEWSALLEDEEAVFAALMSAPWGLPIVQSLAPETFERLPEDRLKAILCHVLRIENVPAPFQDCYHLALFIWFFPTRLTLPDMRREEWDPLVTQAPWNHFRYRLLSGRYRLWTDHRDLLQRLVRRYPNSVHLHPDLRWITRHRVTLDATVPKHYYYMGRRLPTLEDMRLLATAPASTRSQRQTAWKERKLRAKRGALLLAGEKVWFGERTGWIKEKRPQDDPREEGVKWFDGWSDDIPRKEDTLWYIEHAPWMLDPGYTVSHRPSDLIRAPDTNEPVPMPVYSDSGRTLGHIDARYATMEPGQYARARFGALWKDLKRIS